MIKLNYKTFSAGSVVIALLALSISMLIRSPGNIYGIDEMESTSIPQINSNLPVEVSSLTFTSDCIFDEVLSETKYINSNAVSAQYNPNDESEVACIFDFADPIQLVGEDINKSFGWSKINYKDQILYIKSEYISDEMLFWDYSELMYVNQDCNCYSLPQNGEKYLINSNCKVNVIGQNTVWSKILIYDKIYYIENQYLSNDMVPDHITAINYNYISDEKYNPIIEKAYQMLGTSYGHGYSESITDCVGLTLLCYNEVDVSLPWSLDQAYCGQSVKYEEMAAGDIIIWSPLGSYTPSHVGIYVGNGMMIHASSTRGVVINSVSDYIRYGGNLIDIRHIDI